MTESSLSFISSLSSNNDDSVTLSDTINVSTSAQLNTEILKPEELDQELVNIAFDNNYLNSESIESALNSIGSIDSSASNIPDLSNNDSNLSKSNVQSTICNFDASISATKTIELPPVKVATTNSNRNNAPQLLIFQKPNVNIPMLVGKGVPVASASNVAIVQPSTIVSSAAKILTTSNLISAVTPSSSGKTTGDVKILLSNVPCATSLITSKSINSTTVSNTNSNIQAPLKRAVTPSSTGQMITKVIITNNAASSQTLVSPVPVSASVGAASVTITQPQSILLSSPNKTLTLPRNVLNVNASQQIIRALPGTPTKQYVLSPVKPSQKIAYGPVTYSRSPRRIAPATNSTISTLNVGNKVATVVCPTTVTSSIPTLKMSVPQSPTKVVLKPVSQTILKPLVSGSNNSTTPTLTTVSTTSVPMVQQLSQPVSSASSIQVVKGNKFHYVRLVTAPSTSTTSSTVTTKKEATLLPVSAVTALATNVTSVSTVVSLTSTTQGRTTVPIAPAKLVAPKQIGTKQILIPAASSSQIRSTGTVSTGQIGQLPAGTLIPVAGNSQSYVMLPAQYVTQIQQQSQSQVSGTQMLNILPAPTPPSSSNLGSQSAFISLSSNPPNTFNSSNASSTHAPANHSPRTVNGRNSVENDSRQRKPCNCTKSQCLKLYCDCFANGEFCNSCNCNNCYNNLAHEEERQKAIKACLDRNPYAFHPKIGKSREGDQERRHTKGCNCKRSGCLKNYCECYEAKILCTNLCKCIGCKNFEDSSERKTLMHLADAAEVRVQQQAACKTNLSSDIFDIPSKPPVMSQTGERLPFAFVTDDVLEATCLCLLAHASDAEKSHSSEEEIERLVLEEFGRCLVRIIDCANKTKVSKMDMQ